VLVHNGSSACRQQLVLRFRLEVSILQVPGNVDDHRPLTVVPQAIKQGSLKKVTRTQTFLFKLRASS
jgi:hypothetical protein